MLVYYLMVELLFRPQIRKDGIIYEQLVFTENYIPLGKGSVR